MRATIVSICVAAGLASEVRAQEPGAPDEPQTITLLRGDLYEARVGEQVTVFLVTADGILLGDPLSRAAAVWLDGQLAERFPDQPLRYIVHSHHHYDRAEGASLYNGTPERVGHRNFDRELTRARIRLPAWLRDADRNRDGWLHREELSGTAHAALLSTHDQNQDGIVTGAELYTNVRVLHSAYGSRRTIELGGTTVELIHPGPAHAADMTVLFFPDERIVFAVDPPPVFTAPLTLSGFTAGHVHRWVTEVARLEFDTLVTGDGSRFTRAELLAARDYLHGLRNAVADGIVAGRTLAHLQANTTLDDLEDSPHYAARTSHIAEVYDTLRVLTLEVAGVGLADHTFRREAYCTSYEVCSTGGAVRALRGAISIRPSPRVLITGELTSSEQSWSSRSLANYQEEYAFRATRGSLLFGYQFRTGLVGFAPLAGASLTTGDTRGASRLSLVLTPTGGRHPIATRERFLGVTTGVDLTVSIGKGFGLVVPLRVTRTIENPGDRWPQRSDVQAGVGVTMRVFRHVY